MNHTFEAVFDGAVLHPEQPLPLQANTRVRITVVEVMPIVQEDQPRSFLQTARALQLDGPPDWSTNLDQYLDGQQMHSGD